MAKKIKAVIKVNLPAGTANPAPPLGPALGQHGVNIMGFVNEYNEATKDRRGETVPAEITIFEDRSFTFILKTASVADLIKQELKLKSGSGEPNKKKVGNLTPDQLKKIAEKKMADFNTDKLESAINIIKGTARSMGITTNK